MSDFEGHAFRRSVLETIQRVVLDRYMESDSPPKEQIICEEVPRSQSIVPQEYIRQIFQGLELWANDERTQMNQFVRMRMPKPSFLHETAPPSDPTGTTDGDPPQDTPAPKRARRKASS